MNKSERELDAELIVLQTRADELERTAADALKAKPPSEHASAVPSETTPAPAATRLDASDDAAFFAEAERRERAAIGQRSAESAVARADSKGSGGVHWVGERRAARGTIDR